MYICLHSGRISSQDTILYHPRIDAEGNESIVDATDFAYAVICRRRRVADNKQLKAIVDAVAGWACTEALVRVDLEILIDAEALLLGVFAPLTRPPYLDETAEALLRELVVHITLHKIVENNLERSSSSNGGINFVALNARRAAAIVASAKARGGGSGQQKKQPPRLKNSKKQHCPGQ